MSWIKFYENRLNEKYRTHIRNRYKDTFNYIKSRKAEKFGQFGCGMGNATRILIEDLGLNTRHICIDNSKPMIDITKRNLSQIIGNYELILGDIRDAWKGEKLDLIHSHGVLEHFSNSDIKRIINNQLEVCTNLVHYVPGHKYEKPTFGDERLMRPETWHEICKPTKIIESNNGFDLTLVWE